MALNWEYGFPLHPASISLSQVVVSVLVWDILGSLEWLTKLVYLPPFWAETPENPRPESPALESDTSTTQRGLDAGLGAQSHPASQWLALAVLGMGVWPKLRAHSDAEECLGGFEKPQAVSHHLILVDWLERN